MQSKTDDLALCANEAQPALPHLDARLAAAAAYVRAGAVAADIGCDHGKLAVALSAKCKQVIAVDARQAPLANAEACVRKYKAQNVQCRLGDGLAALCENEADTIIVAGLSAQSICDIMAGAAWVKNTGCRFIFIPATKHRVLREYLWREGFAILDETIAFAARRLYTVLHCAYAGKPRVPTALECVLGKAHGPHAQAYFAAEAGKLRREAQGAENAQELLMLANAVEKAASACCHME
jgi:tRNA (adenine22-N1)-methyltransferase